MMIDTHCHLESRDYPDLNLIIEKMKNNIIIVSGCNNETNGEVINLCNNYKNVFGTLGIHPEEVDSVDDNSFKIIEENMTNPKIVGIGEIGLDYHFNKENKNKQIALFKKQLSIAEKNNKPVVIHSRESIEDVHNILKNYCLRRIDIHCFSSSLEMANKFILLGCRLGIGGVLTFKNSKQIKSIVKNIDLKNLLLETDSPYLTPEPYRGNRNEPYNVYYVAEKIAQIKDITINQVIKQTTENAIDQFDLRNKI